MFNPLVGDAGEADGRSFIRTRAGTAGHAVYGPYRWLEPGDYAVEFMLAQEGAASAGDRLIAVLDVTREFGSVTLARREVFAREASAPIVLAFTLTQGAQVEFRAYVTGAEALTIDGHRRLVRLDAARSVEAALAAGRFPEHSDIPFLQEHQALLRQLHERGVDVGVRDGAVVLTIAGVSFFARTRDDINFVGELFIENAYNFTLARAACVIDVGMNLGLASLQFAAKPQVRRVIAFEPFAATYARAAENLALNPALASKISALNHGLGDRNEDRTVLVAQTADSGAMSTISVADGTPVAVQMRNAAEAIGPIVAQAEADGLAVVVKVDCEGSEFAIFDSLDRAGLFARIDAFMVEWHAMFADKSQETLIAPLRRAGFVVFDRSPPGGNGFFYAARITA